jgi:hypothetical protein
VSVTVTVSETHPPRTASDRASLCAALDAAANEARAAKKINVIFLQAENGNTLNLAVGGEETALGFVHGHGNPPYFVSVGPVQSEEPVLTCFQSLEHHTEYPRSWVVPTTLGIEAALEFLSTSELPRCVTWRSA